MITSGILLLVFCMYVVDIFLWIYYLTITLHMTFACNMYYLMWHV